MEFRETVQYFLSRVLLLQKETTAFDKKNQEGYN